MIMLILCMCVLFCLKEAIQKLTPIQIQNLTSSCQTDAGVHALTNTVHVDVERRPHQCPFHPDTLVKSINNRLRSTDIRFEMSTIDNHIYFFYH